MKTCPNCGSKMEADVNFCTVCGTNIKDVALDGAAPVQEQPVQQPVEQPAEPVQPQAANPVQQPVQQQAPVQPTHPQQDMGANQQQAPQINDTFSKISSQVTTAVKNFDKESLWKWFVTSWKTPSAEQNGEKWYGIATLIVEILLFTFSVGAGLKKWVYSYVESNAGSSAIEDLPQAYQDKLTSFFHGLTFDVFLLVLILCAGVLVSSYFANKFVHNDNWEFLDFTNKLVQLSNISSILVLVIALLSFMNMQDSFKLILALMLVVALTTVVAGAVCVKEGTPTTRDAFYGVLVYLVAIVVFAFIAYAVVKGQLASQIQTMFHVDINQYMNF